MKKVIVALGVAVLFAAAATGVASADQPPTTDGFVCPVLGGNAAPTGNANDPIVGIAGGGGATTRVWARTVKMAAETRAAHTRLQGTTTTRRSGIRAASSLMPPRWELTAAAFRCFAG